MTAGIAAPSPAAVVTRASAMPGAAQSGKSVNNAPDGSEQADERRHRAGGSQPGHSLFHAADFFGGSKLHANSHGLQALESWGMWNAGNTTNLALQFAIACRINMGKARTCARQCLRVRHPARRSKNT